jgi:hypothetical protein
VSRIDVDELRIDRRKVWIFNVADYTEATLVNARIAVHLREEKVSDARLSSVFARLGLEETRRDGRNGRAALGGMELISRVGPITKVVVKGFTLEMYKGDTLSLVLKAEEARLGFKKQGARLIRGTIEDVSSKKLIESKSVIIWDNKENVFKIPGEYVLLTPKGRVRGEGIKIKVDSNLVLDFPK